MTEPRDTAQYRHYDADGQLLYIGIAYDPAECAKGHASTSPWWPLVARSSAEWLPTRAEAEAAEIAAIKAESPRYNRSASDTPMNVSRDFADSGDLSIAGGRSPPTNSGAPLALAATPSSQPEPPGIAVRQTSAPRGAAPSRRAASIAQRSRADGSRQ